MSKKTPPEAALYVRLPATAVDKLDRAAEALGVHKKDLVAGLVSKYVDPDTRQGLSARDTPAQAPRGPFEHGEPTLTLGTYSFQPDDELPEVMNPEEAGEFL